jgi:hypothetical protein
MIMANPEPASPPTFPAASALAPTPSGRFTTTTTGDVVTVVDVPLSGLKAEQAKGALSVLNAGIVRPDVQHD